MKLQGLHFQWNPPMGKLMRVSSGKAFLVAVDIRKGSPTLGKWVGVEASSENKKLLWAPACFARGFYVLSDLGRQILAANPPEEEKVNEKIKIEKKIIKKSEPVEWYDEKKYAICYGEMTKAHKKRGFHDSNRVQSIKVKETVCKAFAKGDINDYEGKR